MHTKNCVQRKYIVCIEIIYKITLLLYKIPLKLFTRFKNSLRVYALTPDDSVRIIADDLVKQNKIIGIPDGKTLYVADIGANKTYSLNIAINGDLIIKVCLQTRFRRDDARQ